jgi:dihydrolipoamide dehydrogenase
MGAEVTLIEVLDRILPVEDAEISAFVRKSFEKQGMKILTAPRCQGVGRRGRPHRRGRGRDKVQEIKADRLISAVGIVGNVEDIGLEGTGREGRAHPRPHRRVVPHRRARRLRHRRPHRRALARAQGEPRGA